jgi:hypothetical protein
MENSETWRSKDVGWFRRSPKLCRPAAGAVPQPPEQVYRALMGLNSPDVPFRIRDARDERADLVAEWKIEEKRWAGLFHRAGMRRTTRTLMRLDPVRREVRSVDQLRAVEWAAGIGCLSGSITWGRGQINRTWWVSTACPKPGGGHVVTQHRFSSKQVKEPIQQAVTAAGWTWRGVSVGL